MAVHAAAGPRIPLADTPCPLASDRKELPGPDQLGRVCWAISGMKVSLSGHLAGGCPNLRPMRTAFCGSGAKRDFHPEGTKAPPPPTAVNAQSWATSHMRWESAGATALGREGASTTHSPSKGVTGAFGTPGQLGAWEGGRFQKTPCLPPLSPASPSQNSAQDRSRRFHSGSSLLLLWDASPPWLPSAFVHPLPLSAEGSTKWPPQPSAILCQAGGREGGRRETTAPAALRGLDGAQRRPRPRPALARPPWTWHQPTSWQGGRERRPLPSPARASRHPRLPRQADGDAADQSPEEL